MEDVMPQRPQVHDAALQVACTSDNTLGILRASQEPRIQYPQATPCQEYTSSVWPW